MRKIITTTFVTLDGVMQAPGGREEDTSGDFKYGGWQIAFPSDTAMDSIMMEFMSSPFELLLGKTTYNIFASYWPTATVDMEVANPFNTTKKYVVSHEAFNPEWNNSVCISSDLPDRQAGVVAELKKLKEQDGPDLFVYGSGNLIQTLLKNHLIDQMHLWIHPIIIGTGKKLFEDGTQAQNFKLVNSKVGANGIIFATYEPAGELKVNE